MQKEEEEKQRVLRLKREEEEERVRAAKHRAMLDMENAHIREIMDQMSEEEIEQREAMEKLKKLENERIGKIKADEREKESMANARREAQKLAQDQKVLDLQEKKEGVVDGSQGTDEVNGQTPLDAEAAKTNGSEENTDEMKIGENDSVKKPGVRHGGGNPWQVLGKLAYDAENQDELNINVGDEIKIIDRGH